ncbi:hypothetical protein ACJJTC_013254, partial [Scirpophaga incertulas]
MGTRHATNIERHCEGWFGATDRRNVRVSRALAVRCKTRAPSETRQATVSQQLHRNNCSLQPGRSMQRPRPLPPHLAHTSPLQVTAAGRVESYAAPSIDPAVASWP